MQTKYHRLTILDGASFDSSACVTIRNLVVLVRDGADDSFLLSVVAGLACRLLGSPGACEYQEDLSLLNSSAEGIFVILPTNELEFRHRSY